MSLSKPRSWWWTETASLLQSMGLQKVGQDWATELNWSTMILTKYVLDTQEKIRVKCLPVPYSLGSWISSGKVNNQTVYYDVIIQQYKHLLNSEEHKKASKSDELNYEQYHRGGTSRMNTFYLKLHKYVKTDKKVVWRTVWETERVLFTKRSVCKGWK